MDFTFYAFNFVPQNICGHNSWQFGLTLFITELLKPGRHLWLPKFIVMILTE